MLLGTYQPLFRAGCNPLLKTTADEIVKAINGETPLPDDFRGEPDEKSASVLGFDPVWCFPAGDFKTAFAHSMLTAPNAMDLFFLLDTDNFIRIDKVKHYQNIKAGMDGAGRFHDAIVPDCPDYCSEIVVPVDELKNMKLAFPVMLSGMLEDGIPELPPIIGKEGTCTIPAQFVEHAFPYIEQGLCAVENTHMMFPNNAEIDQDEIDYRMNAEESRLLFSLFILPMLYRLLDGEKFRVDIMLSCSMAAQQAIRIFNRMGRWSYESCDRSEYDKLYEDILACVIDSPSFFDYYLEHGLPGRNDKCPCGSGKKFKKCCGRMLL